MTAQEPQNQDQYVYLMEARGFHGIIPGLWIKRWKIGYSNNPERRENELNGSQAPCPIVKIRSIPSTNMIRCETELHRIFKPSRKHGEWFDFGPIGRLKVHLLFDCYEHSREWNPEKRGGAPFYLKMNQRQIKAAAIALLTLPLLAGFSFSVWLRLPQPTPSSYRLHKPYR